VKYEKWREIEALETIDQFRTAIWNEVEEFRREVREVMVDVEMPEDDEEYYDGIEPDADVEEFGFQVDEAEYKPEQVLLSGTATPNFMEVVNNARDLAERLEREHLSMGLAIAAAKDSAETTSTLSSDPAEPAALVTIDEPEPMPVSLSKIVEEPINMDAIPFPSRKEEDGWASPSPGPPPPGARARPQTARTMSMVDPYETYARRTSVISMVPPSPQPPVNSGLQPPTEPTEISAPSSASASYIVPARSRAGSAGDGEAALGGRTLLRTLSTLSIHDSNAAGAALAKMGMGMTDAGGGNVALTAADAPPSSMPSEFSVKKKMTWTWVRM